MDVLVHGVEIQCKVALSCGDKKSDVVVWARDAGDGIRKATEIFKNSLRQSDEAVAAKKLKVEEDDTNKEIETLPDPETIPEAKV